MEMPEVVVFNAIKTEDGPFEQIRQVLADNQYRTTLFDLAEMDIHPCRSCGSCGLRTAGQCVIGDDMQPVLRAFASSKIVIFITPIRFGGYSSDLKKAIDRLLPVGLPYYIVKGGHMLHPMRYGRKYFVGIGLSENNDPTEEINFRRLVQANGINMLSDSTSLVYRAGDSFETFRNKFVKTIKEIKTR
jgi:multimeric flavodoxin WrbA